MNNVTVHHGNKYLFCVVYNTDGSEEKVGLLKVYMYIEVLYPGSTQTVFNPC